MLENLLRMPWSHVNQFLEALQKDGLPPHLVQRMRMDSKFRQSAVQMLIAKYRDESGEKFSIEVDRTKSRIQLNLEIQGMRISTIRNEIIEDLKPKTHFPDKDQEYLLKALKPIEKMDVWLVPLWQDVIEADAITLLDSMGYESVQTEEALTFALQRRWGHDDWIVVLAAKCHNLKFQYSGKTCTISGFLSFGKNGYGDNISLYDYKDFSPRVKFLVKKKQPQPKIEGT